MLKTYKIQINRHHKLFNYFNELCVLSKNLYNTTNYYIKQYASGKAALKENKVLHPNQEDVINIVDYITQQSGDDKKIPTGEWLNYNTLDFVFKKTKNKDYYALPSHSNQWIMKNVFKDFKSFFESLKEYKKNPAKFKGRPKLPKYKKSDKTILYFTNITCKIVNGNSIRFPKTKETLSIGKIGGLGKLQQIRVIPHQTYFDVEIVLKNNTDFTIKTDNQRYIAIDLGLDNLCAISNNFNTKTYLIKGTPLKSINSYFNKKLALKKSQSKMQYNMDYTRGMDKLYRKRNNKITDYMHKASKTIINYCVENNVSKIIIGNNKQWKTKSNIGKTNNQNFINMPHNKLINQIQYKAAIQGIEVIMQEESYTSKASFLDNDEIPVYNVNNQKEYVFSGKRIHRGLYKSKTGKLINADINGSLNILKKYLIKIKNATPLGNLWSTGFVEHPKVLNIY